MKETAPYKDIFLIKFINNLYINIPTKNKLIFLFCLFICCVTYWFQFSGVAFNDDDVEQLQSVSTYMIAIGRWGLYFLHEYILNHLPMPPMDSILGMSFQIISAMIIATILKIKSPIAITMLVLLSCIHPYFATLYAYDSSRLAYPMANLLVMLSYFLVFNNKKNALIYSSIIFSFAPSLYPASLEYASAAILLILIADFIDSHNHLRISPQLKNIIVVSILGSLLYVIETKLIQYILSIEPWDRTGIDILGLFHNYDLILERISTSLTGSYIFNTAVPTIILSATIVVFLIFFSTSIKSFITLAALISLLVVTPIWMAAISSTDTFPYRSLFSYGLVYGGIISIFISYHQLPKRNYFMDEIITNGILVVSLCALFGYMVFISQYGLKERVAYQADMAVINRMIARAESLQNYPSQEDGDIPLAVIGQPRKWFVPTAIGFMPTNRKSAWAKERVFRLLESRFKVADNKQRSYAENYAKKLPAWPHKDSVKMINGILIIKLGG